MAASADKHAAMHTKQSDSVPKGMSGGGMAGMVQDFQQMAAFGGRGVKGEIQSMLASVKGAFGGQAKGRTQMRWDNNSYSFYLTQQNTNHDN